MRQCVIGLFFFMLAPSVWAQDADWSLLLQSPHNEQGRGVTADGEGNVIAVGTFHAAIDFDPGVGVFGFAGTNNASFIAKYSPHKELIWALNCGQASDLTPTDVVTDSLNNIYVLGTYEGNQDFDPDPNASFWMHPAGYQSFYLMKLSSDGEFQWMRSIDTLSAVSAWGIGLDLEITSDGNPIALVRLRPTADLHMGAAPGDTLFTQGISSPFVFGVALIEYDQEGNVLWTKATDGTYYSDLEVDEDLIYMIGQAEPGGDVSLGTDTTVILSPNQVKHHLTCFDAQGTLQWAVAYQNATATSNLKLRKLAAQNGRVIVAGDFRNTQDIDPGSGIDNRTSAGLDDWFLAEFDVNGNYIQSHVRGDETANVIQQIEFDVYGNLWVYGINPNELDFDLVSSSGAEAQGSGFRFLAKYSDQWDLDWVRRFGKTSNSSAVAFQVLDMHADPFGSFYITGFGQEQFALYTEESLTPEVTGAGLHDLFLMKYSPECETVSVVLDIELCAKDTLFTPQDTFFATGTYEQSYLTHFGCDSSITYNISVKEEITKDSAAILCKESAIDFFGQIITTSGLFTQVLTDPNGCDSTIQLQVVESTLFGQVSLQSNVLVCNTNATHMQWYVCGWDSLVGHVLLSPIAGANDSIFVPTQNGYYAAVVQDGMCAITTACSYYGALSVVDESAPDLFIYPNPADDILTIDGLRAPSSYQLHSMQGVLVQKGSLKAGRNVLQLSSLASGVYGLTIASQQRIVEHRLVVR